MHLDQTLDLRFMPAQVRGTSADMQGDDDILFSIVVVKIVDVRQVSVEVGEVFDELVAAPTKLGVITWKVEVAVTAKWGECRPFHAQEWNELIRFVHRSCC